MSDSPTAVRRGNFLAAVSANVALCPHHYRLRLSLPFFPPTWPGQFVQLQCRYLRPQVSAHVVDWPADRPPRLTQPELTDREPFLRRPLSLAGRRQTADGVELDIIYRAVGTGTRWLAALEAGEELSVLGPLGNAFAIRDEKPVAALIGGGVGIPPLVCLAEELTKAGKEAVAFIGMRSADMLPLTLVPSARVDPTGRPTPCLAELAAVGVPAVISTDDGSLGARGLVSEVFGRWLAQRGPRDLVAYCCGPEPMMKAVGELCIGLGVECQLAMERHMACGMGTCQSCVVKLRDGSHEGWSFKLCCTDGPVFDARQVLWG